MAAGGREAGLFHDIESIVVNAVDWLRLALEVTGTLVIAIGALIAASLFVRALLLRRGGSFHSVRLTFARYLSLALEFQLGADILSTVIAPSWDQIGKLAAIAVIRTALNYFLMHEMAIEKEEGNTLPDGRPPPAP
ncbi:MAG: DUF1622 domain-containing protein [Bacteroidales bacterium]|nr:DUF1622 domain-containing protein [Bacteroidales bacterium]